MPSKPSWTPSWHHVDLFFDRFWFIFGSSWFNVQANSVYWLRLRRKLFCKSCMHALLFLRDSEPRQQRSRRDCCSKNPCKQELHACPAVCNPVWAPPAKVKTITCYTSILAASVRSWNRGHNVLYENVVHCANMCANKRGMRALLF